MNNKQRYQPNAYSSAFEVPHAGQQRPRRHGQGLFLTNLELQAPAPLWSDFVMKNGSKKRAWTSVQVRELKTLARKKVPAAKIVRTQRRSEGATRQKAFSIGLSLDRALTG